MWLGAFGDAVFLAAFSQQNVARALGEYGTPMAAPGPKGAIAGRTVPDVPALHRLLRRAFQLSKALPNELLHTFEKQVAALPNTTEGQFELAAAPDRARRGIVQLAAVLGVIRTLRFVEQRPEWRRMHHELVDRTDEWNLLQSAVVTVAWGADALVPRAVAEADGEGFAERSMVIGLLAWLAWDVETDIVEASQRGGLQGLENEQWYAVQLLAALGVARRGRDRFEHPRGERRANAALPRRRGALARRASVGA